MDLQAKPISLTFDPDQLIPIFNLGYPICSFDPTSTYQPLAWINASQLSTWVVPSRPSNLIDPSRPWTWADPSQPSAWVDPSRRLGQVARLNLWLGRPS